MYDAAVTEEKQSSPPSQSRASFFLYLLVAFSIAISIRLFFAAPYAVSGASMEPSFKSWHYLIVDKVSYRFEEPARGEVVVFESPQQGGRALIKRVIGLPGETVILTGRDVTIKNDAHPDGFLLDEPYLDPALVGESALTLSLKEGEYLVLGDNRRVSADSRVWGALPRENIVGRAFLRLFPFGEIGVFPAFAHYK
jgi:signal peptidase I